MKPLFIALCWLISIFSTNAWVSDIRPAFPGPPPPNTVCSGCCFNNNGTDGCCQLVQGYEICRLSYFMGGGFTTYGKECAPACRKCMEASCADSEACSFEAFSKRGCIDSAGTGTVIDDPFGDIPTFQFSTTLLHHRRFLDGGISALRTSIRTPKLSRADELPARFESAFLETSRQQRFLHFISQATTITVL
ncbi:hypothetical protein EJ06DRAFT_121730 [Trichodelitschia bisporula]|uniref:Apple domain-containing protein n=1 Tax=Trichodelitschia bisporula TaxID=703511 RepID=A0A6G1HQ83_9PEZI|nr:hypothetical protein EJ06DRAFT_121730 [Trichodelitschia bisporula]